MEGHEGGELKKIELFDARVCLALTVCAVQGHAVQGYLVHKKQRPPRTLP